VLAKTAGVCRRVLAKTAGVCRRVLAKTAGVCRRVLANFVRLMSLQLTFAFQQPLLFDLTAL
jgi:hypothetical protein